MADVSACNGSDGSSLTVSGPRPLRENEPGPTIKPKARPQHPGPTLPQSEPPDPNPGPSGLQALPSEDHRTIKASGRWKARGQEETSHPSVTGKSHVTRTMADDPTTKGCQGNVSVSPKGPGVHTHAAGAQVLHDPLPPPAGSGLQNTSDKHVINTHLFIFNKQNHSIVQGQFLKVIAQ